MDRVIQHTVVFHLSTSTYIPNFIRIGKTFCGRTCTYVDVWTYGRRTYGHLRPTLLGRLFGVDLIIIIIIIIILIIIIDLVACAFASAGITATKEPHGLTRSDGKRPDGLTLVLWQRGKPLSWDVTVICPLADSYVELAAQEARSAAGKLAKYSALGAPYDFQPVAVETLGPLNESACKFLNNLGRKIGDNTGDDRSTSFLFQRISVLVHRFNAVLQYDSFYRASAYCC